MGKVLSFPKEKTKRITSLQKIEAKRFFYTFSVFSIIVMAVVIAEKINTLNRPQYVLAVNYEQKSQLNRAVASQENVEIIENIRWGQNLVDKINDMKESDRLPAAVGSVPNRFDQLRYGDLAGKYRLTGTQDQKISEIEYVESDNSSDVPVRIRNRVEFLSEYKDLLAIQFNNAEVEKNSAEIEVYRLLNKSGEDVGTASFQLDAGGRFLSLKVEDK